MLTFNQYLEYNKTYNLAKQAFELMLDNGYDPNLFMEWYEREGRYLNEIELIKEFLGLDKLFSKKQVPEIEPELSPWDKPLPHNNPKGQKQIKNALEDSKEVKPWMVNKDSDFLRGKTAFEKTLSNPMKHLNKDVINKQFERRKNKSDKEIGKTLDPNNILNNQSEGVMDFLGGVGSRLFGGGEKGWNKYWGDKKTSALTNFQKSLEPIAKSKEYNVYNSEFPKVKNDINKQLGQFIEKDTKERQEIKKAGTKPENKPEEQSTHTTNP